jgi:polar amino acid transport system permease protein
MGELIDAIVYALPYLMGGLGTTLLVSLIVVALSLVVGVVLGVGLIYGPLPLRWPPTACGAFPFSC